jgi:hypothetical protein|tara:strand:+ start:1077 stop:1364 length:288 start_codon:yes stop_codon:yes gene_type:complete
MMNRGLIWDIFDSYAAYYYAIFKNEGGVMFARIFLAHPRALNEEFFQHMLCALGFAIALLLAGSAVLVHAFIPCLFEKTASNIIMKLHKRMTIRS